MSCISLILRSNVIAIDRTVSTAIAVENRHLEYCVREPRVQLKWALQSDRNGNKKLRMNWFLNPEAA